MLRRIRRRADVEAHRDVRAELALDVRDALRGKGCLGAVVDRAEGDAALVERQDRVAQREDLKTAGIRENRPTPAGKRMETAEVADDVGPWAEVEVIGVGEHDTRADLPHLVWMERLDGRLGAYRHEGRRRDRAMCGLEYPGSSGAVRGGQREPAHRVDAPTEALDSPQIAPDSRGLPAPPPALSVTRNSPPMGNETVTRACRLAHSGPDRPGRVTGRASHRRTRRTGTPLRRRSDTAPASFRCPRTPSRARAAWSAEDGSS